MPLVKIFMESFCNEQYFKLLGNPADSPTIRANLIKLAQNGEKFWRYPQRPLSEMQIRKAWLVTIAVEM